MTKMQINKDDSAWNMASGSKTRENMNHPQFDSSDSEAEFVDSHKEQQDWVQVSKNQLKAQNAGTGKTIIMPEANAVAFMEDSLSAPTMTQAEIRRCNHPVLRPAYVPPPLVDASPRQPEDLLGRENADPRPQRQGLVSMTEMMSSPLVSAAQFMAFNLLGRHYGPEEWTAYQMTIRSANPPEPIGEGWVLDNEVVSIEETKEEKAEKMKDAKGKGKEKEKETKDNTTRGEIKDDWEEVPDIYCRLPSRDYPPPPTIMERGKKIADAVQKDVAKKVDTATRLLTK